MTHPKPHARLRAHGLGNASLASLICPAASRARPRAQLVIAWHRRTQPHFEKLGFDGGGMEALFYGKRT